MSPSHNPLHQHSHTKWKQPYCPRLPAPVKCPEMIPKTLTHFHVHAPTLWMLLNHIILLCISKHTYTFAKRHTHTHTHTEPANDKREHRHRWMSESSHANAHTHIQWENQQLMSAGRSDWTLRPNTLRKVPAPAACCCVWVIEKV